MRFKTKELMVTVMPKREGTGSGEEEAAGCQPTLRVECLPTVPEYECRPTVGGVECRPTVGGVDCRPTVECYPTVGNPCLHPTRCWYPTRCLSPTICFHRTLDFTLFEFVACRANSRFPEIETLTPRVRDFVTPIIAEYPDQLEVLKEELAATQTALEEIETRISTPSSVEEAERVEASLKEALAQVQERKKKLAKKAEKKGKG
jgi:hypothetical protein